MKSFRKIKVLIDKEKCLLVIDLHELSDGAIYLLKFKLFLIFSTETLSFHKLFLVSVEIYIQIKTFKSFGLKSWNYNYLNIQPSNVKLLL